MGLIEHYSLAQLGWHVPQGEVDFMQMEEYSLEAAIRELGEY